MVEDIRNEELQKELRQGLEDNGNCDCLMLKTQLKKTERSLAMPLAFLLIFDFIFGILILVLFPGKCWYIFILKFSVGE